MCDVLWCYTTAEGAAVVWAALIGLIGAAGAIVGAVIVGLKQSEILAKQAAIAERVAGIEELKLKGDLFDARFNVYHATREWIRFIIGEARPPRAGSGGVEGENDVLQTFLAEWDRSRFLFKPSVYELLRNLLTQSHQLHHHQRMQGGNDDGVDHVEHERAILTVFAHVAENMTEIFGDELILAKSDQPPPKDINPDDPTAD